MLSSTIGRWLERPRVSEAECRQGRWARWYTILARSRQAVAAVAHALAVAALAVAVVEVGVVEVDAGAGARAVEGGEHGGGETLLVGVAVFHDQNPR